jgi:hypothetical protein
MNRFMKVSMIAATIVGITGLSFNAPAEAHSHHDNKWRDQVAMQMYMNNLALQQQQAAYGYYPYNSYAQPSYVPPVSYAAPATYVQPYAQPVYTPHVAYAQPVYTPRVAYAPHASYAPHAAYVSGLRRY